MSSNSPTSRESGRLEMTCDSSVGAIESEKAVLGVVLDAPDRLAHVIERLGDGACFSDSRNQEIYRAILKIHTEGRKPDVPTVVDELRTRQLVPGESNVVHVSDLLDGCTPSLTDQYCDQIIEAWQATGLHKALYEADGRICGGDALADVVADVMRSCEAMMQRIDASAGRSAKTIEEILASPEELEWCIQDLLPAGRIGIISGDGGVGKTWLIIDLALAVAQGKPWLGLFQTTQGPVLIVDEESGSALFAQRLRLLGVSAGAEIPLSVDSFSSPQLETAQGQAWLRRAIRQRSAKLAIIDSLVRVHGLEENDANQMRRLTGALADIARSEQCSIVATHHSRKKTMHSNDPSQTLRGSGELRAGIDMHLVISGKIGRGAKIEHEKARFGTEVKPVFVRLEAAAGGVRLVPAHGIRTRLQEAVELILEALQGTDRSGEYRPRSEIERYCLNRGITRKTFTDAVGALKEDGRVERRPMRAGSADGETRQGVSFRLRRRGEG